MTREIATQRSIPKSILDRVPASAFDQAREILEELNSNVVERKKVRRLSSKIWKKSMKLLGEEKRLRLGIRYDQQTMINLLRVPYPKGIPAIAGISDGADLVVSKTCWIRNGRKRKPSDKISNHFFFAPTGVWVISAGKISETNTNNGPEIRKRSPNPDELQEIWDFLKTFSTRVKSSSRYPLKKSW